MKNQSLRVLIIEDSNVDTLFIIRELTKGGYNPVYKRVETAAAMKKALKEKQWDIILCDYSLPKFNAPSAIALLKESNIDIPLIVVTGAIGEETAAECMRLGAQDYIMKGNLSRLCPTIARELEEAKVRNKQRRAEDALRISEQRYRIAEAIGHIGNWEYNLQTKKFWGSDEAKRIYGFDPKVLDFTIDEVENCIPEREGVHQALIDLIEADKPYNLEFEIHPKNSLTPRIISSVAELKRDEHGNPLLVTGVIQDITKRKQDESARVGSLRALLESQERYKALFDRSLNLISVMDFDGQFIDANNAALNLFGYKREDISSVNFKLIVGEDQLPLALEIIREITKTGIQKDLREIRLRNKGGKEIYLETQGSIVMSKGKPAAIQMIARDTTERKQMEEELRRSEEKYRTILENTQEGYFEVDFSGNFTFFNDSLRRFLGYSKEELMGMNNRQYTDKEHSKELFQTFNKVYDTGKPIDGFDWPIIRKDGTKRYVEASISLQKDSSGKPIGFRGIARDVTERKRMEEELKESEKQYRTFFNTSRDCVFITSINGRLIDMNDAAVELFGYASRDELMQISIPDLYVKKEERTKHTNAIVKNGYSKDYPVDMRRKDGGVINTLITSSLQYDANGRVIGFMGTIKDITERKKSEEALKNSEAKYRNIFENSVEGIYQATIEGRFITANTALARMAGYDSPEELIEFIKDMGTQLYVHPEDRKRFMEIREAKGFVDGFEVEFSKKDGSTFWVVINARVVKDEQGKTIYHEGLIEDITIRKNAEEQLHQTLDRLKKAIGATIQVLVSAVESRDPYTAGHQKRVSDLARTIATEMGLAPDKIEGIRMAGSIHDIGKLSIPAEILSKPTRLTNIEFSLIKEHSQSGYEMLKNVESPWPLAQIVYQHHERINGSGYPRNLKGDEILIDARIMAVADVVEAMASHRPYRPTLGIEAALEEIEKNKGILYDDAVVDTCLRLFREKGYQLT